MNNLKPLIVGCVAGCGVMFIALQYHVVYSHDGLQLIPRMPQATLGLAWADVRNWDAEQWSDRPALVRALIAHGASDLMSESAASKISDSVDTKSGTIGQLRSLLNESRSSEFDAPLYEADDDDLYGSEDDDLAIPLFQETRPPQWDESFTEAPDHDPSRSDMGSRPGRWLRDSNADFNSGFEEFEPLSVENHGTRNYRPMRDHFTEFNQHPKRDPSSEAQSSRPSDSRSRSANRSKADARVRETRSLEDLLFSEEDESGPMPVQGESGFESVTRALDFRALKALEGAGSGLHDSSSDKRGMNGPVKGHVRERNRSRLPSKDDRGVAVPDSIRALREGFDPFLN